MILYTSSSRPDGTFFTMNVSATLNLKALPQGGGINAMSSSSIVSPPNAGEPQPPRTMLLSHIPSSSEISVSSSSGTESLSELDSGDRKLSSSDASYASGEGSAVVPIAEAITKGEETIHPVAGCLIREDDRVGSTVDSTAESRSLDTDPTKRKLSRPPSTSSYRNPIKKRKVIEPLSFREDVLAAEQASNLDGSDGHPPVASSSSSSSVQLLAHPDDDKILSPLHAFIRRQIEVFSATKHDMAQPCPGRKIAIQEHQIGLRCIHCRHRKDRVKRATCYPTSVSRIYHSVNDMKFDHFRACPLPPDVRATFEALKRQEDLGLSASSSAASPSSRVRIKRRPSASGMTTSASTAQYYQESARRMGMVDGHKRVYQLKSASAASCSSPTTIVVDPAPGSSTPSDSDETEQVKASPSVSASSASEECLLDQKTLATLDLPTLMARGLSDLPACHGGAFSMVAPIRSVVGNGETSLVSSRLSCSGTASVLMAQPDDAQHLNALHCFVRKRIEFFSATEQDVASPCPGRKTRVLLGQVGLRCTRCCRLPFVDRVKRAVCFPPSIKGLYHAVSNMKYDHFISCRGLDSQERTEFLSLREASSSRKGPEPGDGSVRKSSSSATSRFYTQSALRVGLVDTKNGIRFESSPSTATLSMGDQHPPKPLPIEPVGMTALMLAATDAGLREAFEKSKAV